MTDTIPTIDLSQDNETIGRQLDDAYSTIGFCQIINHGLDLKIEEAAWHLSKEFFARPEADKRALTIPESQAYGYGPFQAERLAASLGNPTPPDLKETFAIGPFRRPDDLADDDSAAFVYSPNLWPTETGQIDPTGTSGFAGTMEAHYHQLAELVDRLMQTIAVGLKLPANHFEPFINEHTSALRLLHYPPTDAVAAETGQLRAGAHADYGTLTLLRQDDAPGGLEVLGVDGRWHAVPAREGAYVVNVGDALARWTNDRWKSTIHRVVLPPVDLTPPTASSPGATNERFSMAFFHNANWDAEIRCLPTCQVAGEAPRHKPITAGQHLMDKFRSTQ